MRDQERAVERGGACDCVGEQKESARMYRSETVDVNLSMTSTSNVRAWVRVLGPPCSCTRSAEMPSPFAAGFDKTGAGSLLD